MGIVYTYAIFVNSACALKTKHVSIWHRRPYIYSMSNAMVKESQKTQTMYV